MEEFIEEISDLIEIAEEVISTDTVGRKIMESLARVYPEIDEALANYDRYAAKVDNLYEYADEQYENIEENLTDIINNATNDPWEDFPE